MSPKTYNDHGNKEFPWCCGKCRKFDEQVNTKVNTKSLSKEQLPESNQSIHQKYGKEFLILHYNYRSVQNKEEEIHHICNYIKPTILCITETWLDKSHPPSAYVPQGYSILRCDRSDEFKQKYKKNNAGGVAILYKSELKIRKLKNITEPEESIWVEVKTQPSFILGLVYRAEYSELLQEKENGTLLETQLNELTTINNNILVMGDFNCDTANTKKDKTTSKLNEVFDEFNMKQEIKKPTRIDPKTMNATTIDHVWADPNLKIVKEAGTLEGVSDHTGTYTVLNTAKEKKIPEKIRFRCYKNYSSENFNEDLKIALEDSTLKKLIETEKVNEATERWVNIFKNTAEVHAPMKEATVTKKTSNIPWFTSQLKDLVLQKKRRLQLYWLDGFISDLNIVKTLTNKINHLKRQLKKSYYSGKIEEYEGNPKKMWTMLKEVTYTKMIKNSTEPHFLDQNRANQFNNYFATIGSNIQKKLNIEEKILENIKPGVFNFHEETEETIIKLIDRIKPDVAVGHDEISAKLLKDSKLTVASSLTKLVNLSYKTSTFPDCMKKGIVKAVHKKEDTEDPANYRPLTILSVLSKVFERSAADQQMTYYLKNNILNKTQHAYMKGHSTETCLNDMINYIYKQLDEGKLIGVASLDLSKAFDSISHSHLLQKLSNLGLSQSSLQWCKSYLTKRKQQTKFKKFISTEETVTSGVPQGSIMGPIMFISFVNDLADNFENCKIVSYADDTQILVSANTVPEVKKKLENLIDVAQKWYTKNSLLNNITKTEIMLISGRKHQESLYIDIIDEGIKKRLQPKASIKILGVFVDQKLNWKKQIQEVNKKAKYAARNLQRINNLVPLRSRLLLYNSLVASHLKYADTVWAGCDVADKQKLQRTQNLAVKSILGMKKYDSASEALKKAKLLPLDHKQKIHEAVYIHKGLAHKLPSPICDQYNQLKPQSTSSRSIDQQLLNIHSHKTEKYKHSPLYRTIKIWNSIPLNIKTIENSSTFKKNLQQHFQKNFNM